MYSLAESAESAQVRVISSLSDKPLGGQSFKVNSSELSEPEPSMFGFSLELQLVC
jgi:hypothetical protein